MNEKSMLAIAADGNTSLTMTDRRNPAYQQLQDDCIRLLRILPGNLSSDVRCEMALFHLYDQPTYTALSYTWGAKPASCTVFLNGHRLSIRKNLWRFLSQVRKLDHLASRWLWIDAVCNDQTNNQ